MKGQFVVVEGIGGSGKGTLLDRIEAWCKEMSLPYIRTLTLGGTYEGDFLRKLCREGIPGAQNKLDPMTEALLFNAARAENLAKVVRPALAEGKIVLCDRFLDSTLAYQGSEAGVDVAALREIHHYAHDGILPDYTFLLDGSPEIFQKRIHPEEFETDQFDRLEMERQIRIRELYLNSANWAWGSKYYEVLNAEVSPDQVFAQAIPVLMEIQNRVRARPKSNPITQMVAGKVGNDGINDRSAATRSGVINHSMPQQTIKG